MRYSIKIAISLKELFERRRVGEAREHQEERLPSPTHIAQEPAGQYGHQYGNIGIDGHARVQIGDTIHHHHNRPQLQADKYELLLASLTFDRKDARLQNVAAALPTTCQWLNRHEQFVAWTDVSKNHEHHGFLWIKGKPGSGKSTIMKETLAWAERHWASQIIISYFFNARSTHHLEKSSLGLYRSLLHQLLLHQLSYSLSSSRALFEKRFAWKAKDGNVDDWTETELQNFLIELITTLQLPVLNIFIDALDEGSDNDVRRMVGFLERLTRHATTAGRLLRICLSSRHYPYISIERSLSLVVEDQVGHSRDIELYIHTELKGNSPYMNYLRCKICDRSAGIFLWVVLVVYMLNKAYDKGKSSMAIVKKLEEIPPDLHDVFAQIFSKDLEDFDECIMLLQWVLFSMRPLSPIELYYAVQYTYLTTDTVDEVTFPLDGVDRYLLDCSRGLVELTKAEPFVVQFIHETVRDYLLNKNMFLQRQSGTYGSEILVPDFQADSCHMKIAEECLHYLLNVCEKAPLTEQTLEQYPLAPYTAEYWWQHVQTSKSSCSQIVLDLALRLLTGNGTNLLTWVQLYDVDYPIQGLNLSTTAYSLASPLFYAALVGIPELIIKMKPLAADVNAQGGEYGSALQAASDGGHEKVVQILLDKGADVNAQGGRYGNALQAASARGHEKVVQILLDKGADVNAQGGRYGNALQAASDGGHEKVVQILLDKGADVNTQGGYGNALQAASVGGHEKVVQILVEKGADVNAQGGEYGITLYTASAGGHEKVVQMLLDKGADVNARGEYGNALQVASDGGYEKVVQILLDKGADVNAQGRYGNALQAASARGHEKVVQILLDKGADVNAQGGEYGNALQAASAGGHEEVVQMLLDKGADVNSQGGEYGNALYAASARGHEKVVQILLEKGADVNAQGRGYGNALQAASDGGYEKVVQILLGKGADVNAQGRGYGNALQVASVGGHEKVVQILLDKGADVNAQGRGYGNALQAASAGGHEEVVQMLLDKGADVNSQGGEYGNALYAASARGHEKVVQILVEKGADVNAQGRGYGNALQAASDGGYEKVVQILLGKGADVNAQGRGYGNALQAASVGGHEKVVQILLDKGADVNAQGRYGNALQAASARGHEKVGQMLLKQGAKF